MAVNEKTDVLIIGAGAAGIMAATCAAAYGLNARVIDKRHTPMRAGHGDGNAARLMEILDTFGLANKVIEAGHPFCCTHSWRRGESGKLERSGANTTPWAPPSPFHAVALTQARTAGIMLEYAAKHSDIRVERGKVPTSISIADDWSEYPVTINIAAVSSSKEDTVNNNIHENVIAQHDSRSDEVVKAKYVVACDGAHSWTRKHFGVSMVGDDTDLIWGVLDIVPVTDLPSVRTVNVIATEDGSMMWIPRENNMIRIYTVMSTAETDADGKLIRSSVTPEKILEAARKIMYPYKLEYISCEWWAAYQVGQRVATDNTISDRVFLAGDAVHTHSPQAGQGLNVSMHDTYNLMWKLNLVVKGLADEKILKTYSDERLILGQQLVDFDRKWAALVAGRAAPDAPKGIAAIEIERKDMSNASVLIFHGLQILYRPGLLIQNSESVAAEAKPFIDGGLLPPGITVGMRMPSHPTRHHASGFLGRLGDVLKSNGRFKIIVFPGDISVPNRMERFRHLADQCSALMRAYTPPDQKVDSVFEVVTVHTADPLVPPILDLPEICHPFDEQTGWDYGKVFFEGHELHDTPEDRKPPSAYHLYGVDPEVGVLVVVRPDGYVALKCGLGEFDQVNGYFDGFMLPQTA